MTISRRVSMSDYTALHPRGQNSSSGKVVPALNGAQFHEDMCEQMGIVARLTPWSLYA
jgi:hypothetical protein